MSAPGRADDGAEDATLDVDLAFGHHLLAVDAASDADDVEQLAASWFEDAGWVAGRVLALTDESVLTGPWTLDDDARRALRLAADAAQVYLLRCPVLRARAAPARLAEADPLVRAFPDGLPYGAEFEAVGFLLAAARRLGGTVRIAGSGHVLTPDPAVDLTLHSLVWLDPDALVATLRPALPTVHLATELADFSPPDRPATPDVPGEAALDEGEREWLHAEAHAFDEEALSYPPVLEAYGAVAELGADGIVEVAVEGEEHIPLVLRRLDWTEDGVVAYAVRWWPPGEQDEADARTPDSAGAPDSAGEPEGAGASGDAGRRERARALVERAALALYEAAAGEITDEAGFLVEPESLAGPA